MKGLDNPSRTSVEAGTPTAIPAMARKLAVCFTDSSNADSSTATKAPNTTNNATGTSKSGSSSNAPNNLDYR